MIKLISNSFRNFCSKSISDAPSIAMSQVKAVRRARYDGRTKKRKWEDRRSDKGESLDLKKAKSETETDGTSSVERIKRKKFAILMGYSGAEYYGMQRNPNTKTIEEELFKALHKTELINDECFSQVQNMQFQRAARTDKGVSAARQIVSLKLPETIDIVKINEHLPEEIRVFGAKRVTKGFNSKSQCDGRTYFYMFPTVAFASNLDGIQQEEFRSDKETFDKLNRVLGMFVGTKNFHNFTSKKKPNDPSATRYIKTFICEEPFVRKNVEFAVMKVRGQSFMLHQIRKMIGLTFAILRNQANEEIMTKAFAVDKISIPRAPGLGLVLDYVHYERYNYRYGEDGMHEKLTWEEVDQEVNDFKEKYIYPTIIDTEIKEQSMITWIQSKLSRHSYDEDSDDNGEDDNGDDTEDVDQNEEIIQNAEQNIKDRVEGESKLESSEQSSVDSIEGVGQNSEDKTDSVEDEKIQNDEEKVKESKSAIG